MPVLPDIINISIEERLTLFHGLLACAGGPRLSRYDGHFVRIGGDDDEASRTEDSLFSLCRRGVKLHAFLTGGSEPVLFSGRIGLLWILCSAAKDGKPACIHALGPFLPEECSSFSLDSALANAGASLSLRAQASVLLRSLPVLPYDRIREYAAMLYYLLYGEQLAPHGLRLLSGGTLPSPVRRSVTPDDRQFFAAEQETLRRIRDGDLTLRLDTDRIALGDTVLRTSPLGDHLRQMKDDVLARLTLLSRAAMAGGLSPETGYALWEKYVQNTEAVRSPGELISLLLIMQEDFAGRVHAVKTRRMSKEIEAACGYIEQHLEEPLTIDTLAALDGYAGYYFSRKFRQETGMTPAEYIRQKRLQKAAVLLLTTGRDVREIGASLQFCSHSFFSECFRRQYGVTPSQYRRAATP